MNTRKQVAALAAIVSLVGGAVAASPAAHAASVSKTQTKYISGTSLSKNTKISGTYRYYVTGYTGNGEPIYGGSFSNTGAKDAIKGNGLEAVFALSYYTWSGGAWHASSRHAVKVNRFDSWTFKNKKRVYGYACDRKVGTKKLINCKAWTLK
ncbi:hypothetical protein ACFU8Q_37465 [Streptomyces sp. NPDC057543]|uniref:hypothetical protein n=1 Tax=Streptomyces sp. NPDC057543 TaxID=3346163 RepID=UPI003693577E